MKTDHWTVEALNRLSVEASEQREAPVSCIGHRPDRTRARRAGMSIGASPTALRSRAGAACPANVDKLNRVGKWPPAMPLLRSLERHRSPGYKHAGPPGLSVSALYEGVSQ